MGNVVSFPELGIEIAVERVAFTLFGAEFYWYGILIALGAVLAVLFAFSKFDEFGLDQDRVVDVIMIGTVSAIIGSRLYYVIFSAPGEFSTFGEILDIRKGGVAFYGAIIGAFVSAAIACKLRGVRIRPALDLAAIGFLIGQGIGRWGNFINQEAFGANTSLPWGMTGSSIFNYLNYNRLRLEAQGMTVDPLMPVHPTFLYESLWCLAGFALLALYIKRRRFDGEIFLMYLAWNGAGRSVIEGLRTDSLYWGSVRISQILAIIWVVCAALAIIILRKHIAEKRKDDPEFEIPYGHTEQCREDMAELSRQRQEKAEKKSVRGGVFGKLGSKENETVDDEELDEGLSDEPDDDADEPAEVDGDEELSDEISENKNDDEISEVSGNEELSDEPADDVDESAEADDDKRPEEESDADDERQDAE